MSYKVVTGSTGRIFFFQIIKVKIEHYHYKTQGVWIFV